MAIKLGACHATLGIIAPCHAVILCSLRPRSPPIPLVAVIARPCWGTMCAAAVIALSKRSHVGYRWMTQNAVQ